MRPFGYARPDDLMQAVHLGSATGPGVVDAPVQYLAGGTTLIDLMKLDVLRPQRLVDIGALAAGLERIEVSPKGLRLGALAKMAAVAEHPALRRAYPVIAQSLTLAASAQLRNMATLGGNVLQKTRCPYYRDTSWSACNKRSPGSGCTAIGGSNRNHAILGVDESCIAQYPGDFAIALIALDAQVELRGLDGSRSIPLATLHRDPQGRPDIETNLKAGEIIVGFEVPAAAWYQRSLYVKVRDRASYEFARASAAVALDLSADGVREARIGLGGMAYRPWRALAAERFLVDKPLTAVTALAAADVALRDARTHGGNAYKPELARQTIVRALLGAKDLPIGEVDHVR
ncbi:MAG TPA: xanthine dehydrogenase family protein subunit M [Steroidobacteraceae bacterium]|nr:xanthine dehydrogenase family protein subunit M [Steroidobacteraceae bacterium]